MRYAPTCLLFVRRGVGSLHFGLVRRHEGVCDTPLHLLDEIPIFWGGNDEWKLIGEVLLQPDELRKCVFERLLARGKKIIFGDG